MDQIMCAGAFFLWVAAQFAAVVAALRSRAGMNRGQIAWMLAGIVALGSFAEMAGSAIAQTDYPNRTIKIVVPVPPGPLLDAVPRIIADKLSARWGQPVIVENKPGGAQNLATEAVAKAAPDGYTLLVAPPAPLTVNQYVFPKLSFDPAALTPVSTLITFPLVVVVNPKLPVSNLAELIAYAKVNPGKLTYGSPGLASTPQLATESFLRNAGVSMVHVPYQGLGPAIQDLIGGRIDVLFDAVGNSLPHIAQGTLKPLAVTGEQRVPALQHVRTVSETIPGFVHNEWFAMVAPPQTPPAVVDTLSQAVADVLKMPDVVARLAKLHAVPVSSSPAETAALIKRESARWKEVVARAGIRIE
jgi:tripartite-type tricarboxylate transporter receptor subunit TctC